MPRCAAVIYLMNTTLRCQLEVEHVVHEWRHANMDSMGPDGKGGPKYQRAKVVVTWEGRT